VTEPSAVAPDVVDLPVADVPASPSPAPSRLARIRRSPVAPKLLFESALIILSVLLGLALNGWQERRRERALAEQVVANFRREISGNVARLRHAEPMHRRLAARLDSASHVRRPDESAFTAFAVLVKGEGVATEPLRDAAWETAVSTGALRLLDYERASSLSEVYLVQRSALGQTMRLLSDRFLMPQNFDPAARETMLQTHRMLMIELAGQESYLLELYARALRTMPESPR
jgi:hypothetical protein